jgi:peptidoglycan/LPS O-acetylase OafA/YrhL
LWTDKAYEKPIPGYETLVSLTPKIFSMETEAASRFWWSLSGPSLLLSISQLSSLKILFETGFAQYLGKISFCLYLIHNFCVVLFGIAIKNFLMDIVGLDPNMKEGGLVYWVMCAVWFGIFTTLVFALAAAAERWVDRPNVRFSKWFEGYSSGFVQKSVGRMRESNGGPRD